MTKEIKLITGETCAEFRIKLRNYLKDGWIELYRDERTVNKDTDGHKKIGLNYAVIEKGEIPDTLFLEKYPEFKETPFDSVYNHPTMCRCEVEKILDKHFRKKKHTLNNVYLDFEAGRKGPTQIRYNDNGTEIKFISQQLVKEVIEKIDKKYMGCGTIHPNPSDGLNDLRKELGIE